MASGSDSEGSVQLVEDQGKPEVTLYQPKTNPPRRRNICLEKNGVAQPIPSSTRGTRSLAPNSEASCGRPSSYGAKRTENKGGPRAPPPKRPRQSHARDPNTNLEDVVEVEETFEASTSSQAFATTTSCQQKTRYSERLEQKKAKQLEFNMKQVRQDRARWEKNRKRSMGNSDSIEVLDVDEERQQSARTNFAKDSSEQPEHENGGSEGVGESHEASEHHDEVVPVEEEEVEEEKESSQKEPKDTAGVDAPYTGSTHLIFEFPPGERGKIRVTEEERGRLSQRKYLNDSLIDFYIKYHESDIGRRSEELRIRATFFSSFFFGRLRRTEPIDYDGVKGWTKRVDIFTKQFVFVPICDSYHWSLIIVANLDKLKDCVDRPEEVSQSSVEAPRIIYLDSLDPKRGTEFGETMRQYLVEEWLAKRLGMEGNTATRKATSTTFKKLIPILRPNVPIQTNEYDCGLYLLNSFEMFLYNTDGLRDRLLSGSRDARDVYSHVEITMLRKNIINLMDILENQWLHEQLPREGEFTEDVPDDVKISATEENVASEPDIFTSKRFYERVDGNEKLDAGTRRSTSPGQNAAGLEESIVRQSCHETIDSAEHVSSQHTTDVHKGQPERTHNGEGVDMGAAVDVPLGDKETVDADINARCHSSLPATRARLREEEYDLNDPTLPESNSSSQDRVTHYYTAEVEEVPAGQYDEELGRAPSDSQAQENEVLEVVSEVPLV